jgi:RNA polymerase sigma factor (sigma-70 family)
VRAVIQYLRKLADRSQAADLSDGQLLKHFIEQRDEAAFAALVRRHGPVVLSVCQRVLHNVHDSEDAFQATFLVLARKAHAIAKQGSVGSWLHGVAYRIAVRAKHDIARRRWRESQTQRQPPPDLLQEVVWRDLRLMLDEEVLRLPDRCRQPFVLCYLQGKTNEEAARLLGYPKGTVLSRLARARQLLRARLARRGLTLSAGLVVTLLSQGAASAAVPATLVHATARIASLAAAGKAAAGTVSAQVLTLAEGVSRTMGISKFKIAAALFLAIGLVTGAVLAAKRPAPSQPQAGKQGNSSPPPIPKAAKSGKDTPMPNTTLEVHGDVVWSAAFAPDGKTLATVGGQWGKKGEVILWDPAAKKVRARVEEPMGVRTVAFAPDGKTLATADFFHATIKLRDPKTGKARRLLRDHNLKAATVVNSIAFSPDCRSLAAAYLDGFIEIWDLTGDKVRAGFSGHPGGVFCLAISPNGKTLVTAGGDKTVKLWDLATGERRLVLTGHTDMVETLAISPDGRTLASGSWDKTIRLWEMATGKQRLILQGHKFEVLGVAFARDGRTLASAASLWGHPGPQRAGNRPGEVKLWDLATGKARASFGGHRDRIWSVAFTPNDKTLATTSWDKTVKLWNAPKPGPSPPAQKRTDREWETLWGDLTGADAVKAHRAIWALIEAPEQALPLLKKHIKPATATNAKRIATLIAELDDDRFSVRERASKELAKLGEEARPALERTLKGQPSVEVQRRAEALLSKPPAVVSPDQVKSLRALEVLEQIGSADARQVLRTLAKGAPATLLTREAKACLDHLARRPEPGKRQP